MGKKIRSRFVQDVASLLGGQGLITIIAMATSVVMARALGAEGRGHFALALLLPSMLATFSDLGVGAAGTRFTAARRWPAPVILSSQALAGAIRMLVAVLFGLGLIIFASDTLFPGVPREFMLLGLIQIVLLIVASYVLPLLLGLGKGPTYSGLLVLSSALSLGALSVGWVIAGLDVRLALLLQVSTGFLMAAVIWRTTCRATGGLGRPSVSYLQAAYRFGAGVHISSIANFAGTRLILLLVNGFTGAVGVGLFTIAQTASDRVYLLADAVGTILLPKIAEDPEGNSNRVTPVVFRITLIMVISVSLVLGLIADWLIRLLFTDTFAGSIPVLQLLLVASVFSSGWRVLSQDFNARGYSKITAIVNSAATAVGLGVAAILLPRLGLEGAACAAIVSTGLSLFTGVFLFGRYSEEGNITLLFVPSPKERELAARLMRGVTYVLQSGPRFWWALMRAYLLDGFTIRFARLFAPFRRRIVSFSDWVCTPYYKSWARRLQSSLIARKSAMGLAQLEDLGLPVNEIGAIRSAGRDGDPVVIGEFDHYGRLIPWFGPIEGLVCTTAESSRPRTRTRVMLVVMPQGIAVRKEYLGGDSMSRFLRELRALERLRNTGMRVPEILSINVDDPTLIETFIPGADLEQVLGKMGAELTGLACRTRLGGDPTFQEIFDDYISEGARYTAKLEPSFLDAIYEQIKIAHRHGVKLNDLKYGNIIIHRETGLPFIVDFDSAEIYAQPQGLAFLVERDRDIERLNSMLGTSYLTYHRLRERLNCKEFPASDRLYASTYIGHGLRVGPLWDRTTGFGRWHFILKSFLRFPKGARVLSLGPNNASVELHLLREGAAEVVAYERDPLYAAQGCFLARACEWADNREYHLRYVQADMREVVNVEGRFDYALSLCSLYYLPEEEMRCLASVIIQKAPQFILQCNIRQGIDREDPDQYRRASLEFAIDLLHKAGFTETTVMAPRGYSRPLVSGVRPHSIMLTC